MNRDSCSSRKRRYLNFLFNLAFYLHFILWGLYFSLVILPTIAVLSRLNPRIEKTAFRFAEFFYRSLIRLLESLGAISIAEFSGQSNLNLHEPCIYISNHRTMLDVLIYLTRIRNATALIKAGPSREVITDTSETSTKRTRMPGWWAPFISVALHRLGYIRMPPGKSDMEGLSQTIEECREALRQKRSIIIFPEGTRSRTGRLQQFLTLPFKLAYEESVPIVPLVIHNPIPLMPKGSIWFDIPFCVPIRIRALEPILPSKRMDSSSLMMKARKEISRELRAMDEAFGEWKLEQSTEHSDNP